MSFPPPSARLARIVIALVLPLAFLASTTTAHAGTGYGAPQANSCTAGADGGRDAKGNLYLPCGANVKIIQPSGASTLVPAPAANGVAPSPDGTKLYLITTDVTGGGFRRAVLSNGAYRIDTTFTPQAIKDGTTTRPFCGYDLATDHYGYIYVSIGGWCRNNGVEVASANAIVKYRPDGRIVTRFGSFGTGAGQFQTNMGVAVSPDGRRVYVSEAPGPDGYGRVQYFDWTWSGDYALAGTIRTFAVGGGSTATLSAAYSVEVDPWGYVYVASTTQAQIYKFTADGTYVTSVYDAPSGRAHTFSVDGRGWVYVPEFAVTVPRAADNPVPGAYPVTAPEPKADLVAPKLSGITAPAETTEASVRIHIDATDDVRVTEMRLADESGDWGPWRAFAADVDVPLTAGLGLKVVAVQVRDVRDFRSDSRSVTVLRRPVPDNTAPTLRVETSASTGSRVVTLSINSADAVGVTHLRIAGDSGDFGEWIPWSAGARTLTHDIGEGFTTHVISVQVRDAAFNVADTVTLTVALVKPSSPTAPSGVVGGGDDTLVVPPVVVRDLVAPRIARLVAPRSSCSRSVILRLAASDDASRVTFVRVANEDGRFGRWQPYRAALRHTLTRGATRKLVTVQVRDAAGNISAGRSARLLVRACRR